jgi:multidrug transporter EmrE-like cation transporter
MLFWYILGGFIGGLPLAWGWGKYLDAMKRGQPYRAAVWDVVIILLASVLTLTLWSASGDNVLVMVAYSLGSGIGTVYVVKHNKGDS